MTPSSPNNAFSGTPPTDTLNGEHNSLFMVMSGLGSKPASGRLLRGLTPFLDQRGTDHVILLAERQRREPWTGSDLIVPYQEVVHWARGAGGSYRGVCIKGEPVPRADIVKVFKRDPLGVVDWVARRAGSALIASDAPLLLAPCQIPKPWGRELWFTGMEARGVSEVRSASGSTQLPYALGMFPVPMIGEQERPPILLKILEPHREAPFGDLYLEIHREKWEVYVVLDVAAEAWPDGIGRMRAGLAPDVIARYREAHGTEWESTLMRDLGATIAAYEAVRREIDGRWDAQLARDGLDPALAHPVARYRELYQALPAALRARERAAREAVDAFLGHAAMPPGQVAVLAPGVLHALRHGVAVVEFQTPTYERLVAMASQKVLTQAHWDTREALALAERATYQHPRIKMLTRETGVAAEEVVQFPEFRVQRVQLEPDVVQHDRTAGNGIYDLIFVLSGEGMLRTAGGDETPLGPRGAMLLGASMGAYTIRTAPGARLSYLLARPTGPASAPRGG